MIRADSQSIFLINFSLAWLFRNPATYSHIPYSTDDSIISTLPFTSINGQQGHAQSRRDDLESLAYTIICSACGGLPWTNFSSHDDHKVVLRKKSSITVEKLCKGLPVPFCKFISHVHSLSFDEEPNYQYLHSILSQCSEIETDPPGKVPLSSACPAVHLDSKLVIGDQM
jgi:hypothetical protein